MEELHHSLDHRTAWVRACPSTKLPHRLLWHRAGLLAHHRSAIRKMLMSGLLWAPERHSWGKEDVWHHMNSEHRMGFSQRESGLVSPMMGIAASYGSLFPSLKDAAAAHGSMPVLAGAVCLAPRVALRPLLHSFLEKGPKLSPGHIQPMGQWLVLRDPDHLSQNMVPCLALHIFWHRCWD